jgi:hypothetical protein
MSLAWDETGSAKDQLRDTKVDKVLERCANFRRSNAASNLDRLG